MSRDRPSRAVKIGDRVTWASCVCSEVVLAVRREGVEVAWALRGRHFVAWDGFSHDPGLKGIKPPTPDEWSLRFDNKEGDYVDGEASFAASLS